MTHEKADAVRDNASVRAFTRGLAVLRLLASRGTMTATEIGREIGLHQSSASRLLRSLAREGYVYKPHFHRFALDIKVLLFAGMAMEHFEEVREGARVCSELHRELGCGVAAVMLRDGRLIYLARIHEGAGEPLRLVDDSSFPVHRSSPGLLLSFLLGRRRMARVMKESMTRCGDRETGASPSALWELASRSLGDDGVLYLERFGDNRFSASIAYDTPRGRAALTLYSHHKAAGRARIASRLRSAARELGIPAGEGNG